MRRRVMALLLSGMMVATLGSSVQAGEPASEAEEMVTEVAETEKAEDVRITLAGGEEIELQNLSGVTVSKAELVAGADGEATGDEGSEEGAGQSETLQLTDKNGDVHSFPNFPTTMTDPVLYAGDGFFYIRYAGDGDTVTIYEDAPEITFDKPQSRFVTDTVNIREEPDSASRVLATAGLGQEVSAIGAGPHWVKVQQGDVTGYISRLYLSAKKADAEAAVAREQAARAAAEAAARAAAAAATAAAAASDDSGSSDDGPSVVSRESIPDCDGSGHGYTVVTYSDGSTSIENY